MKHASGRGVIDVAELAGVELATDGYSGTVFLMRLAAAISVRARTSTSGDHLPVVLRLVDGYEDDQLRAIAADLNLRSRSRWLRTLTTDSVVNQLVQVGTRLLRELSLLDTDPSPSNVVTVDFRRNRVDDGAQTHNRDADIVVM